MSDVLERETPSCLTCGSNVRMRWIVHAISMELFGESKVLKDFPKRKTLRAMGMSDPPLIADGLKRKIDYQNTYFDCEPRLDITRTEGCGEYDFVIASEVLEHVAPPVQKAFKNLASLLRDEGFIVFSVPYEAAGSTIEHFPDLHDWRLVQLDSGYVLVNRTTDGRLEIFDQLCFHGGPGITVEMRIFAEEDLLANFRAAGFGHIQIAEDYPPFGILWEPWARGMLLKK